MDHDADDVLGQDAAVDVDEPQIAGDPPEEIRNDDGMDEDEAVGVLTRCVTFSTPGSVPAACLPTRRESGRQDAGKPQGPSGPIGMGGDTAAAARQNADEAAEMETDDRQEADEDAMNTDFVGNFDVADSLGRFEPSFDDEVSTLLLNQLGSVGRSHRRESCSAARRLVTEVYSPPRITKLIRESRMRHVMPGYALDLQQWTQPMVCRGTSASGRRGSEPGR